MNTHTNHSLERISERLTDAGISANNQATLAQVLDVAAATVKGAVAIEVLDLGTQVNEAWGDRSNGNLVYAIVRGGRIVTTFLRRSTQTNPPDALRVDRIVKLIELV